MLSFFFFSQKLLTALLVVPSISMRHYYLTLLDTFPVSLRSKYKSSSSSSVLFSLSLSLSLSLILFARSFLAFSTNGSRVGRRHCQQQLLQAGQRCLRDPRVGRRYMPLRRDVVWNTSQNDRAVYMGVTAEAFGRVTWSSV